MIDLAEARHYVLEHCRPLSARTLPIGEALGCVTADEVVAGESVPPFANTAVDGFAVQAADTTGVPVTLPIVGTIPAGAPPSPPVGPGEAVRILTGAPMPPGADAVVMVEHTTVAGDQVTISRSVATKENVRAAGSDVVSGDLVLERGVELTPAHLGVLASIGRRQVSVVPRMRVGVLSTGDELVEGDGPLQPGQIRESNRGVLLALVAEANAEPVDLGLVADDEDAITAAISDGATRCDAILTSGGVSVGDFDYVKVVLDRLGGGTMRWMQIAIRPAKPFVFGTIADGERRVPVFGLPGNPVSSLVSFELLARPGLRQMMGHRRLDRLEVTATAEAAMRRRPDGKVHFVRCRAAWGEGGFGAAPTGDQGSHQMAATARANALAVLPDGDGVEVGQVVRLLLIGWPD